MGRRKIKGGPAGNPDTVMGEPAEQLAAPFRHLPGMKVIFIQFIGMFILFSLGWVDCLGMDVLDSQPGGHCGEPGVSSRVRSDRVKTGLKKDSSALSVTGAETDRRHY